MRMPTVLNIEGPVVVFGAGKVGARKVEYVKLFTDDVKVISEKHGSLPDGIELVEARVTAEDFQTHIPESAALVIAALSDPGLNHTIAGWCMERGVLVNVVDDPEHSSVLFPALSKDGDLNIAVSTSGRCPFVARKVREELDASIREKGGWLELLAPFREMLAGIEEKNRVLETIFNDEIVRKLMKEGNLEDARKRAQEVFDVSR